MAGLEGPALTALAEDLALMRAAAEAAGPLVRAAFGKPVRTWQKGAEGPVTEVDLAVNDHLQQALRTARPGYGWLSEESPDTPERLARRRVFHVDPIDGTRAFLQGKPECAISIGLSVDGAAVAGVVYNPISEELFTGAVGLGAWCNEATIRVSARDRIAGAALIGREKFYQGAHWPTPWAGVSAYWRFSIAYRLAHLAMGKADGGVMLGFKHEWDIVGGLAIVLAAGGVASDPWGGALAFNRPDARLPGVVAAGPALHPLLLKRVSHTPHPKDWRADGAPREPTEEA